MKDMIKIKVMFDIDKKGVIENLYCVGTIVIENKQINESVIINKISESLNNIKTNLIINLHWELVN